MTKKLWMSSIVIVGLIFGLNMAQADDFMLTSPTLISDEQIAEVHVFNGFGCIGENQSPALNWTAGPAGTKSYAITVYDPDAPTGSGWWHWVVYNIPAVVTSLPAGAGNVAGEGLPAGAQQGRTDFGTLEYGGPCPPEGDRPHRYIFTVHALKTDRIDVPADATAALIGFNLYANTIAKATFTAKYGH